MPIPSIALSVLLGAGCSSADTVTPPPPPPNPPEIRLVEVTRGAGYPVFVTAPPGDLDRLFIVDKGGRIRIVKNGALLSQPFLDLSGLISTGGEQGLLGLAFHPNYAANGRLVVHYTIPGDDIRIAVYRVSANPDLADPASGQVILPIEHPFSNHNGGMLAFGPDGQLYIGIGDGGGGGDPQGNGQNRNTLLGKLLRVSLNDAGQMTIPSDNPFTGQSGARGEVWSYGLRNPWRFSFDRQTGDLYIGDVGQNAREEIDVATQATQFGRGLNFGWNIMEGSACFSPASNCNRTGLVLPVLDYGHSDGCSVTGGYVYRGTAIAGLAGTYFYSDYCSGWVKSFRLSGTSASEPREWPGLDAGGRVTSFGEDARGELYLTTETTVYRIAPK